MPPARWLPSVAALSAVVSIAVGAAAVHGVTDTLAKSLLQTGVQFELPHAIAVFALLGWRDVPAVRGGAWALLAGSLVFARSLDLLALGAPRWTGAITPVGGSAMLLGWLWLALAPFVPERR
ncbi:MAG: DUF423 domain-containing protein [Sphingomonadaceae bacterium]|nr:DUF423 domain-containing protein [Sphingomonadaceae bacterium]